MQGMTQPHDFAVCVTYNTTYVPVAAPCPTTVQLPQKGMC